MEMTDKKQYRENLIFNTKYLIRDVFNSEELNNIKEFIDEIIEMQKLNNGKGNRQNSIKNMVLYKR